MSWKFDQAEDVACITCRSVISGASVLVATHYEEDHSWAFLDGKAFDPAEAMVVAMSEVVAVHPDLSEIADLPPGWTTARTAADQPWIREQDIWAPEDT